MPQNTEYDLVNRNMTNYIFCSATFLVAAELFPTPVRSIATSLGMAVCTIGAFIAPLIADLQLVFIWLPYFIFGCCAALAGILCLLLPETKCVPIMNTIQEGYEFHKKSYQNCCKKC